MMMMSYKTHCQQTTNTIRNHHEHGIGSSHSKQRANTCGISKRSKAVLGLFKFTFTFTYSYPRISNAVCCGTRTKSRNNSFIMDTF